MLEFLDQCEFPRFRKEQMRKAWFDPAIFGWEQVSTLPKDMRESLRKDVPWTSLKLVTLQHSETAFKGLFELHDGKKIESVLMINSKGDWTACVSSEVGCAMACDFCATGTMGFHRDLTVDEIVDQVRFWRSFLAASKKSDLTSLPPEDSSSYHSYDSGSSSVQHQNSNEELSGDSFPFDSLCSLRAGSQLRMTIPGRLSNVVMMGMGEPLNNYENVRDAMRSFVEDMELGKTKITLSTVGVKRGMDRILDDPLWPDVRVAISLHYADQKKRAEHMPVSKQRTLNELKQWCLKYQQQYGNRSHHITFEYLMLENNNDGPEDIQSLVRFLKGIDRYKVNLIPWNEVGNLQYNRASEARTQEFQKQLKAAGVDSTIRKSLGRDIDGGCGQLVVEEDLVQLG